MNKVWILIKREFLTNVVTKGFIISTILGPILLIGISLGPAYFMSLSSDEPVTIRVVDQSGLIFNKLEKVFDDTLKNGQPQFIFSEISQAVFQKKKEEIKKEVESGLADGVLIVDPDILEEGRVTYMSKTVSDIELMRKLRSGINQIVNNYRLEKAGIDPQQIKELTRRIKLETVKLVKGEEKQRGFDEEYFSSFIFLMMLYVTLLIYGSAIMRGVIEEKSSRIIEVLLSSTNSFQLMLGKLFGVGAVGLVQYIIWTGMASIAFLFAASSMPNVAQYVSVSPVVLFYFVIFFVIGFFTFSTLFAAVGAMCSDMQDAQTLQTPVTMMIIIPFLLSFMIIKDPTTDLAQILSFIPFFTPLIMFLRISLVMPPFWQIALSLLINIVTIFGIVWLSAKIYRVGILMYGKRPTFPEIIRWLRYR